MWDRYEVAIVSYYSEKARSATLVRPTRFQATYTSTRKFKIQGEGLMEEYLELISQPYFKKMADDFKLPDHIVLLTQHFQGTHYRDDSKNDK